MRISLPYLCLMAAVLCAACQQQPASQATSSTKVSTVAVAQANSVPQATPAPTIPKLSTEAKRFFAQHDLAPLMQLNNKQPEAQNGFYGPDQYRIEFVLTDVQRDVTTPQLYHVKGKNRFKGVITPFEGTVVFEQMLDQPKLTKHDRVTIQDLEFENKKYAYSAIGNFTLREDARVRSAGVFRGQIAADFIVNEDGTLTSYSQSKNSASRRGRTTFKGTWTSNISNQQKSVVWVKDIFSYQGTLLKEFIVGGRALDFNPEYAKLGWNSYWENEEWWAEPNSDTAQTADSEVL